MPANNTPVLNWPALFQTTKRQAHAMRHLAENGIPFLGEMADLPTM